MEAAQKETRPEGVVSFKEPEGACPDSEAEGRVVLPGQGGESLAGSLGQSEARGYLERICEG